MPSKENISLRYPSFVVALIVLQNTMGLYSGYQLCTHAAYASVASVDYNILAAFCETLPINARMRPGEFRTKCT